ncbi:MAG: diacylglycerol kinase family lipid kinase [Saprospiraceae bacterium]|nr:diacylglycerol kinase family lipid kinase [Saprospiraceae bacterium]
MKPKEQQAWYVIVNPAACNGAVGKQWPSLEAKLLVALPGGMDVAFTQYAGHATQLAAEAIASGYRRIVAVGGDGTNHEVTNGILMQTSVPATDVYYALLPVGTGNDWARHHGISKKLEDWLSMISKGQTTLQDVARVSYFDEQGNTQVRYGVNVVGLAYDAFVTQFAQRNKRWIWNRFFYLVLVLRCLMLYKLVKARVTANGMTWENRFYTINAGICKYSGGGLSLVPHAVADDGLLAVTVAGPLSKLGVLFNTYRFYNGTIGAHPKIDTVQSREVVVEAAWETPVYVEADGELLGQTPVEITVIEKALRIIVP